MKQSYVNINGKKYIATSGNDVVKSNTDEEINEFLFGENSIHAKYTKKLQELDELIKNTTYKAGRPAKTKDSTLDQPSMTM